MFARTRVWLKYQNDQHKACVYETLREYVDFNRKLDKKQLFKTMFRKKYWGWWILLAVVIALSVALSVYHDRIVLAIRPVAEKIVNTPGAWAVPVAALIVVSIPPLIGHEIIILVVGVLWGLWWGFAIAVAGTFIGEILTYYLFKYMLRERAKKFEAKSRLYAGLAHVMRRDGLWMITLVRWSYLPGHLVTCIQSTIGISVWIFGIACAISLPKQLALVYLGVLFGDSHKLDDAGKSESQLAEEAASNTRHKIVSWTVLCLTGFLSVVAMYVIWFRMWQEEKRLAALAPSIAASSIQSESKDDLVQVENGMQYTLPYIHSPSLDTMNRDRSASYASTSTSTSPPAIHATPGRPNLSRSRSSTFTSLALSTGSLPYLPYTPMLDVNTSTFPPIQNRNSPSPVPAAVVSVTSATSEGGEGEPFMRGAEAHSTYWRSDSPYGQANALNTSSIDPESDVSMRPRHVRLARSSSNILVPTTTSQEPSTTKTVEGDVTGNGTTFVERSASPLGRHRTRSRASSNLSNLSYSYTRESSEGGVTNQAKGKPHPLSSDFDMIELDAAGDGRQAKNVASRVGDV